MDYVEATQRVEEALAALRERSPLAPAGHPEVRAIQQTVATLVYERGLTVHHVLEIAGVRDHNAQTRFRAVTGETIWQYITRLRIDAAAHLLAVTDAPAYLIGRAVGYSGAETFSRAYKRRRGVSPGHER